MNKILAENGTLIESIAKTDAYGRQPLSGFTFGKSTWRQGEYMRDDFRLYESKCGRARIVKTFDFPPYTVTVDGLVVGHFYLLRQAKYAAQQCYGPTAVQAGEVEVRL